MSHISKLKIRNYRGIQNLTQDFGDEKFIVLIGRGDSGKSTILSAINSALSPSWNLAFSDLDFYKQCTTTPIEIELTIKELPQEFLNEMKFGMYVQNELNDECNAKDLSIILNLTVDQNLEPHWTVKARPDTNIDDKPISAGNRALLAVNYIGDFTDNQFSYNRQSPLYALTKPSLGEGETIERVKSELVRSLAANTDNTLFAPLNKPLESLQKTAEQLGLNVNNLLAGIDIKDNPYTGNSIAMNDDSLPYRLHGKGNKRLMSIAIQYELTKQGGIVLIDELEQGLEPDRITTLVRALRKPDAGQVFITTHSLNVILEAASHNLFIVNKDANTLKQPNAEMDAFRRSNPQAFFAKRIICCEGKTEQGFIRAFDNWIMDKYNTSLSAKGVAIVDAKGGDQMYRYATTFKSLGYETCVFADDDKSEEIKEKKKETREKGIELFLCDAGNCLESQIIQDLPWEYLEDVVRCNQSEFPKQNIEIDDALRKRMEEATAVKEQDEIRNEIIRLSIDNSKPWFKHIPGGESLGSIFFTAYNTMNEDKVSKKNVNSLLEWCGITLCPTGEDS